MNKKAILVIFAVIFFVSVTYFIDTDGNNVPLDEVNSLTNLEKENNKLKEEIVYLKQDVETLKQSLFEAEKFILDSERASDYLPSSEAEILYKDIGDTRYFVLFRDKAEKYLTVASAKPRFDISFTIPSLNPTNGITMDYIRDTEYNYFGGIITDKNIKEIQVLQDKKVHKAIIFKLKDNIYGWYSIFQSKREVMGDSPDNIRIQALGEDDVILWQETN